MKRDVAAMLAMALVSLPGGPARGDDNDAKAILDKAIKALGGEAKLRKAEAMAWKASGMSLRDGNWSPLTTEITIQGFDRLRNNWIDGNLVKGVTVISGDKAWRKAGAETRLIGIPPAQNKRNIYLMVDPITLVPLKGKGFQIESAGEERVGERLAVGIRITGPEGKDFNLYFDKESGFPVKLADRVSAGQGREITHETTFADYKDFDGIKKATKIELRRDGEKIVEQEITDFKVLDKVAPETFAEPK